MQHSLVSRAITGASAALLAAVGLGGGGAAHAASAQPMFSYAQGWRVEEHVRLLGDVNGDLRADIVGFGDPGVLVAHGRADGSFGAPVLAVRDFGRHQGWRVDRHVRDVVDVDGDGRSDLVGFGDAGTYISYAQADGSFTAPELEVRDFGYDQGWRVDRHPREVGPVVRTSRSADIVGFGHSGVLMARGRADRTFTGAAEVSDSYGYDRGWRVEKHPRMLTDLEGGTQEAVLGFGDAGTYVSHWSIWSEPFFDPAALKVPDFGFQQGWRVGQHPREPGDVNGDRRADVVGFGGAGVYVSYAGADRTYSATALRVEDFGARQGWRGDRHLRTLADVNGDRIQDLVGFGNAGMHVAHGQAGSTFGPVFLKVAGYGSDDGWTEERYPRLLGDVNGDGREDVVGFGHSATSVTPS